MSRRLAPEHGFLHWLFEASLLTKAIFAAIETLAGAAFLVAPHAFLQKLTDWLTQRALIEAPSEPLARAISSALAHFDANSQHFYAIYLLGHGALKLALLFLLARRIAAAYPLAIAVFAAFIIYQMHRWQLSGSPMMVVLSVIDVVVIALTWHEWRGRRIS